MLLITHWFRAFAWTLGLELVVASLVLWHALPLGRRLSVIVIANVATHPAVWLIFPELAAGQGWPFGVTLTLSEAWAFGFEAWVYWVMLGKQHGRIAVVTSVAANACSLGVGFALRGLGWL